MLRSLALIAAALAGACTTSAAPDDATRERAEAIECLPLLACGCPSGCREFVCDGDTCSRPQPLEAGRMGVETPTYRRGRSPAGAAFVSRGTSCYGSCAAGEPHTCARVDGECRPVE